ncbi:MAG: hypothetical protein JSV91_07210 [Phycisphaerales bacterium]|nr:MAG: hypothetical protein JSV91_07210 [Phycisphaerales bacterium]
MLDPRLSSILSTTFSRIITPAWLLTGALFKLYFDAPSTLPKTIYGPAHEWGIDLQILLYVLIALEFVLFGVMVLSARWARPVAIAVLSFFALILINEVRIGSDSCGCMGGIHTPPLLILIIDGVILIGELLFKPILKPKAEGGKSGLRLKPVTALLAVGWVVASFGVAFGVPALRSEPPTEPEPEPTTPPVAQTEIPPPPLTRPPDYYVSEPEEWIGSHWYELDVAAWLNEHPADITKGRQYVIFYNPTCDHCFDLLDTYFLGELPVPTTVIAFPQQKNRFDRGGWDMPCENCDQRQLRFGCDWLIQPPLVVALEDGIVKCATEAEDVIEPQCLIWHE